MKINLIFLFHIKPLRHRKEVLIYPGSGREGLTWILIIPGNIELKMSVNLKWIKLHMNELYDQ